MVAVDGTVRILDGAFEGFIGRVASVDVAAGTAVVTVRIFGRETPVEVGVESVESAEVVDAPPPAFVSSDPTSILDEE